MNPAICATLFLAQQSPSSAPAGSGGLLGSPIFMIVIMIAFMYLLIIRPQQKQRKEQEARMASLKKGDNVITAGGVHAIVHHVSEKTVTLKLSEGVFVPFEKTSITTVSKPSKEKNNSETPASNEDQKA